MKHRYEQVLQWYIEKLSGTISAEDNAYVEQMLEQDISFRQVWQSIEVESETLNAADFLKRIDVSADLAVVKEKIEQNKKSKGRLFFTRLVAAAAILLLLVASAFIFFKSSPVITDKKEIVELVQKNRASVALKLANGRVIAIDKDSVPQSITAGNANIKTENGILTYTSADTMQNTLEIPEGKTYNIVLSDGTEIWLNAASSLRFPFRFNGHTREVYVTGEAFFKVAKDAAHPFIVHTPLTQVEVLGTSFNVNSYNGQNVKTALVEGRVLTKSSDGKAMQLQPGFEAVYEPANGFVSGSFDEEEVLSWMNGICYFHNMSVEQLIVIASRFYGLKIVIDNEQYARRSVTGMLEKNKLADFLTDLETTAGIRYYYSGDVLHIK